MPLVGEAHIIVRAITTGVADDIKRGFNDIDGRVGGRAGQTLGRSFFRGFNQSGSTDIFGRLRDGIRSLVPEADGAREAFKKLTKTGYYLQAGLSILVGGIAAVIGGLVALGGTALGALPSFASLANIMIALKLATGIAKFALGGVGEAVQQASQLTKQYGSVAAAVGQQMKQLAFDAEAAALGLRRAGLSLEQARENLLAAQQLPPNSRARREAELAYEEADLAYRRAQEQAENAEKAKKRGAANVPNDPYANLTASQKKFAQFLVTLQDQLKVLKEAAASGFLPILQTQIQRLNSSYFPTLVSGFKIIGTSVGKATKSITDMLVKSETVKKVDKLFKNSAGLIEKFGVILSKVFDSFLTILNAVNPQAERFLNFLVKKLDEFNALLKKTDLEGFFKTSGDIAADFGKVFGNLFDAIGGIVMANFGPGTGGQYLLDWLKDATGAWAKLNDTVEGRDSLKNYFLGVAKNAKIIFQTVGAFFSELKGIGADPIIGETFKILQKAAPELGEIFKKSVQAGPAFATFVLEFTRFVNLLTDESGPKIFFDTLAGALKAVNDALDNPFAKKLLQIHGAIVAVVLALGSIALAVKFVAFLFMGALGAILGVFSKIAGIVKRLGQFFKFMKGFLKVAGNLAKLIKLGGIVTVVVALVARFIELVATSEQFRDMLSKIGAVIGNAFGKLMKSLGELWNGIMKVFGMEQGEGGSDGGLMGILNSIIDVILYILVPAFGHLTAGIINAITFVSDLLGSLFNAFGPGINKLLQGFLDLFQGKFQKGLARIFGGIAMILLGIVQFVVNAFIDLINFMGSNLESFVQSFGAVPIVGDALRAMGLDPAEFKITKIGKVDWVGDANKNLEASIAKMADGGTVYPRTGGTMVTVAEAGRPERIEPLDSNGLSERDRALISEMSSNGVVINMTVNPTPDMDVNALTSEISRRIAFSLRKGSAAI